MKMSLTATSRMALIPDHTTEEPMDFAAELRRGIDANDLASVRETEAMMDGAADEIERLTAALKPFAERALNFIPYATPADDKVTAETYFTLGELRAAKDA